MALELLKRCGMIWRSEKRRLLGIEALGTEATELGFSLWIECPTAVIIRSDSGRRNTYQGYFPILESVVPLLNLF